MLTRSFFHHYPPTNISSSFLPNTTPEAIPSDLARTGSYVALRSQINCQLLQEAMINCFLLRLLFNVLASSHTLEHPHFHHGTDQYLIFLHSSFIHLFAWLSLTRGY